MPDQQEMFEEQPSVQAEVKEELGAFELESDAKFNEEAPEVEETKEEVKEEVKETEAEEAPKVEAETSEEVVAEEAPKQKKSTHVPYTRFQEINERYKALQAQVTESQPSEPAQADVKEEAASPQGGTKYSALDPKWVESLKESMPEQYSYIKEQQLIEKASEKMERDLQVKQAKQNEVELANHYNSHFADRFANDFTGLQDKESELFKGMQPRLQQLGQEYPTAVGDPGFAHALARLVSLEQEVTKLRSEGPKGVKEQIQKTRAAKKEAALTGQAKYDKAVEEDDIWAFKPAYEK